MCLASGMGSVWATNVCTRIFFLHRAGQMRWRLQTTPACRVRYSALTSAAQTLTGSGTSRCSSTAPALASAWTNARYYQCQPFAIRQPRQSELRTSWLAVISHACMAASPKSQLAVFAPPTMMMLFSPASHSLLTS